MKRYGAIAFGLSLLLVAALDSDRRVLGISPRLPHVGRIIEAAAPIPIKPAGAQNYYPVAVGTRLWPGTLIFPPEGMRVRILCAAGNTWVVPSGVRSGVGNGCPPPRRKPMGGLGHTRGFCSGTQSATIPYIISPRSSFLIGDRPLFRWNAVEGATEYEAILRGEAGDIWRATVTETEAIYDGERPLQPGSIYRLIVRANNGATSEAEEPSSQYDETPGSSFRLLPEEEAEVVRSQVAQLAETDLTESGKILAMADIYTRFGLRAEAIALLEAGAGDIAGDIAGVWSKPVDNNGILQSGDPPRPPLKTPSAFLPLLLQGGVGGGSSATTFDHTHIPEALQMGSALMLGNLYCQVGLTAMAERYYSQAIERAKVTGDLAGATLARTELANLYAINGETEKAIRSYQQALEGYARLPDLSGAIATRIRLGNIYRDAGNKREARQQYEQALEGYRRLADFEGARQMEEKINAL
ncbi:MAG: tetratricopeptide repeat protein [Oscillatoria sp. SIO1A7]|nr:tetratricopeptide repeat protein [Oscillatoria sp. SIO1A7]